jgi:hypothetical protein
MDSVRKQILFSTPFWNASSTCTMFDRRLSSPSSTRSLLKIAVTGIEVGREEKLWRLVFRGRDPAIGEEHSCPVADGNGDAPAQDVFSRVSQSERRGRLLAQSQGVNGLVIGLWVIEGFQHPFLLRGRGRGWGWGERSGTVAFCVKPKC